MTKKRRTDSKGTMSKSSHVKLTPLIVKESGQSMNPELQDLLLKINKTNKTLPEDQRVEVKSDISQISPENWKKALLGASILTPNSSTTIHESSAPCSSKMAYSTPNHQSSKVIPPLDSIDNFNSTESSESELEGDDCPQDSSDSDTSTSQCQSKTKKSADNSEDHSESLTWAYTPGTFVHVLNSYVANGVIQSTDIPILKPRIMTALRLHNIEQVVKRSDVSWMDGFINGYLSFHHSTDQPQSDNKNEIEYFQRHVKKIEADQVSLVTTVKNIVTKLEELQGELIKLRDERVCNPPIPIPLPTIEGKKIELKPVHHQPKVALLTLVKDKKIPLTRTGALYLKNHKDEMRYNLENEKLMLNLIKVLLAPADKKGLSEEDLKNIHSAYAP